jgi:hypothetical protein
MTIDPDSWAVDIAWGVFVSERRSFASNTDRVNRIPKFALFLFDFLMPPPDRSRASNTKLSSDGNCRYATCEHVHASRAKRRLN